MKIFLRKSQANEPFTFIFADNKGNTIVKSENYKIKKSAQNGIESVKKNSQVDNNYEFKESKNGKFYFNIKAPNGQVVGTSAMFNSTKDRDEAIKQLKEEAPEAEVTEE